MFHWICPECGREIPPAARECSVCDPAVVATASTPPQPAISKPQADILLKLARQIRANQAEPVAPVVEMEEGNLLYSGPAYGGPEASPLEAAVALLSPPDEPEVAETVGLASEEPPPAPIQEHLFQLARPLHIPPPAPARGVQLEAGPPAEEKAPAPLAPHGGRSDAAPDFAPLHKDSSGIRRGMRLADSEGRAPSPFCEFRVTLAGPLLPTQLNSLKAAGLRLLTHAGRPAQARANFNWLVSLLVTLTLVTAGAGILFYMLPNILGESKPASAAVNETPLPAPASRLAKTLEVTGIRIVVDLNNRSEIHYLVVNHASAALNDRTVFVTLRPAGVRAGQSPLSRFSFHINELGPYESREIVSPIEKLTRAATALPEWQDLRADVDLGE